MKIALLSFSVVLSCATSFSAWAQVAEFATESKRASFDCQTSGPAGEIESVHISYDRQFESFTTQIHFQPSTESDPIKNFVMLGSDPGSLYEKPFAAKDCGFAKASGTVGLSAFPTLIVANFAQKSLMVAVESLKSCGASGSEFDHALKINRLYIVGDAASVSDRTENDLSYKFKANLYFDYQRILSVHAGPVIVSKNVASIFMTLVDDRFSQFVVRSFFLSLG